MVSSESPLFRVWSGNSLLVVVLGCLWIDHILGRVLLNIHWSKANVVVVNSNVDSAS